MNVRRAAVGTRSERGGLSAKQAGREIIQTAPPSLPFVCRPWALEIHQMYAVRAQRLDGSDYAEANLRRLGRADTHP